MSEKLTLYVANVPTSEIGDAIGKHVDGFTLQTGIGYWKGDAEVMTIATVLGYAKQGDIMAAVSELAAQYGEDSILLELDNEHGKHVELIVWDAERGAIRVERL